jgi:hypothetical protein
MASVKNVIKNLNINTRTAKEVLESSGRGSARASAIKNSVNKIVTNMSGTQQKVLNEVGEAAANSARQEGINAAVQQVKSRTAEKAINRAVSQNGTPTQVSRDFINNKTANRALQINATGNRAVDTALNNVRSKRVNQVIDGHNAQSRQTAMDTIVNNAKDQNINRVPKDNSASRQAVNKGLENVNTSRTLKNDWLNNDKPQMPIVNGANYNTTPQASRIIQEGPSHPKPTEANFEVPKQDFKEVNRPPEPPPEANINTNSNSTQGRNNRSKSKANRNNGFVDQAKGFAKEAFGGVTDTYRNYQNGQDIVTAFSNAHRNADGSVNMLRAGGTFVAASAAARVASGGGLYKDRYGNPNLIGVPFI